MNRLLGKYIYIWPNCHTANIWLHQLIYIWFVVVYFISSSSFNADFIHNLFFGPNIALYLLKILKKIQNGCHAGQFSQSIPHKKSLNISEPIRWIDFNFGTNIVLHRAIYILSQILKKSPNEPLFRPIFFSPFILHMKKKISRNLLGSFTSFLSHNCCHESILSYLFFFFKFFYYLLLKFFL